MTDDADFRYALELQRRWNAEEPQENDIEEVDFKSPPAKKRPIATRSNPHSNLDEDFLHRTQNLVHPQWETLDPTPDVFALFTNFDAKFFQSRLKCVTLEWSKRMYSCAGICYYRSNRFGMDVTIRLSEPLLKLRPRKDLVETMLHEMIHAYCFVLNIREGNGGHGPNFKKIMYSINKVAGTNITVYHNFNDEVNLYKQHWWRCNGSCQNRSPFFGYVKRTSNRAPGPNDQWWEAHQESCGGTFMKIKEPEKKKKEKAKDKVPVAGGDLRKFFDVTKKTGNTNNSTNINGFGSGGSGFKGPTKSNGGGTMLLNPKNSSTTTAKTSNTPSIAAAFPPTSYPGLSTDPFNVNTFRKPTQRGAKLPAGGNLRNVTSLKDLNTNSTGSVINSNSNNNNDIMSGRGYSMNSNDSKSVQHDSPRVQLGEQVDRNHLRDIWAKRYGTGNSVSNAEIAPSRTFSNDDATSAGGKKRPRATLDTSEPKENAWIVVDDDLMLQDKKDVIITLSSSDEEDGNTNDSSESDTVNRPLSHNRKPLTADERQHAIKQEILDESSGQDDDIILIDDEYDDNEDANSIAAAVELADTSIIDEFFGEDTLLKDFKRENDVRPSGSRHKPNPSDDIITCPICQGKMKRSVFSEHLDGCTGIAIRIQPPKYALKKPAATSREAKPTRKSRKSTKDILRSAGYTEQDLANITSTSSMDDEDELLNNSGLSISSPQPKGASTDVDLDSSDENTRRYRQRNLFKTTRQCPICAVEIEEDEINEHLDECLKNKR